jgi:hypothetical protein
MATVTIKYDSSSVIFTKMLDAISHIQGVEILDKEVLTLEEMQEIEQSRRSGILYDIDKLQAKLVF